MAAPRHSHHYIAATSTISRTFASGGLKPSDGGVQPGPPSPEEPLPPTFEKESKMPWQTEGWFSTFLKSKLGPEKYETLRSYVLWTTDDIHNLEGIPRPDTQVPITKDGKTKVMFRYPSPGNRKPPSIPSEDAGSDPYDIGYYKRDTRRRGLDRAFPNPEIEMAKAMMLPEDDPRVDELKEKLEAGPGSSPGNKGMFATGKSDYDPTGLRATMSANHDALNKSLDAHEPNHLPTAEWENHQDEIIAKWEARGLPVPPGEAAHGFVVPVSRRVERWGGKFGGGLESEPVGREVAQKIFIGIKE